MKTFTSEECQVIVKAVDGLSRAVKILADNVYDSFDDETFAFHAKPFEDIKTFSDSTIFQLNKIQNRLQS